MEELKQLIVFVDGEEGERDDGKRYLPADASDRASVSKARMLLLIIAERTGRRCNVTLSPTVGSKRSPLVEVGVEPVGKRRVRGPRCPRFQTCRPHAS